MGSSNSMLDFKNLKLNFIECPSALMKQGKKAVWSRYLCKCTIYNKDNFFHDKFAYKIERLILESCLDKDSDIKNECVISEPPQSNQFYGSFYFYIDKLRDEDKDICFKFNMINCKKGKRDTIQHSLFFVKNEQIFSEYCTFNQLKVHPEEDMFLRMIRLFIGYNDYNLYKQLKKINIFME